MGSNKTVGKREFPKIIYWILIKHQKIKYHPYIRLQAIISVIQNPNMFCV